MTNEAMHGKARHKAQDERIARAKAKLEDPAVQAKLAAQPSPNRRGAEEHGETMLDWAVWMMDFAGRAGKIRVCQRVEKL